MGQNVYSKSLKMINSWLNGKTTIIIIFKRLFCKMKKRSQIEKIEFLSLLLAEWCERGEWGLYVRPPHYHPGSAWANPLALTLSRVGLKTRCNVIKLLLFSPPQYNKQPNKSGELAFNNISQRPQIERPKQVSPKNRRPEKRKTLNGKCICRIWSFNRLELRAQKRRDWTKWQIWIIAKNYSFYF